MRKVRGIALVEVLVAIGISALLLTATAVALNTAVRAYHINQQQALLLQHSRVAMTRMLSTVRRSKLHAPDTSSLASQFAAGATTTGTGIAMYDQNGVMVTYRYDAPTRTVQMVIGSTAYPLVHGVDEFTVSMEPMRSSTSVRTGGGWDLLRRATILLTLRNVGQTTMELEGFGDQSLTLSASVMPRRNTW
jgi:type II secretory pathway pseudopilin PulG